MADGLTFTAADKLACAKRELAMRERVYPRWVKDQRMTQANSEKEIAIMRAIVADYQAQADALEIAGRLL